VSFAPSPQPPPSSIGPPQGNFHYTLREKILITGHTGKPAGQATWDYLPDAVRTAVLENKGHPRSG
jgi:hypothetical protein